MGDFNHIKKVDISKYLNNPVKLFGESPVKIFNNDVMIGNLRMVISETDKNIKLYPCSIYCIVEDGKYSFF